MVAMPVFAATSSCGSSPTNFHDLLSCYIQFKMQTYVPFLIAIAVLVFLIGVVRFVGAGDNEELRKSGRDVMIFGIIVLFVMVSVWGIVGLVYSSFLPGSVSLPTKLPNVLP